MVCSTNPLTDQLPYQASVRNVVTGERFGMRVMSYDACIFFKESNQDKSLAFDC